MELKALMQPFSQNLYEALVNERKPGRIQKAHLV